MIPYCDTPRQSLVIAILAGSLGGVVGLYSQSIFTVILATVGIAFVLEILVHEYRQDDQYMQAKKEVSKRLQS